MSAHPDPEQLSAYVDGELTGADRDDLEQHLRGCSDCSATVRALRGTLADMRALPQPVPSEQTSWALRSAIAKARKKPAERYRRWMVGAGTVAAAVIAIVAVSLNTNTHRETFGASRPNQAADALGSSAVPIAIDQNTNYTQASATALLSSYAPQAPKAAAANPSPSDGRSLGQTTQTFNAEHMTTLAPAEQARYAANIRTCESSIFSTGSGGARAVAYVVGKYESTPVFFLVYSVVASGKSKTEMWVVQQSDCYPRLFLAPR